MAKRSGFSLIELMVVIAIVAVLAAVAYPSYKRYLFTSKLSKSLQFFASLEQQITQFYYTHGHFPNPSELGFETVSGDPSDNTVKNTTDLDPSINFLAFGNYGCGTEIAAQLGNIQQPSGVVDSGINSSPNPPSGAYTYAELLIDIGRINGELETLHLYGVGDASGGSYVENYLPTPWLNENTTANWDYTNYDLNNPFTNCT